MNNFNRDDAIQQWRTAKLIAAQAAAHELELRKALFATMFPNAHEGMNTVPLGNGWELKGDYKFNYNLDRKAIDGVLDKIEALGERGKLIAERLVKFSPELSLTEYRKISGTDATDQDKVIASLINTVLTVKPGTPALEVKEPAKT